LHHHSRPSKLTRGIDETQESIAEARQISPEAKPVRMTRRQLAMAESAQEPEPSPRMDTVNEETANNTPQEAEPIATKEEAALAVDAAEEVTSLVGESSSAPKITTSVVQEEASEDTTAAASPSASSDAATERPSLQPLSTTISLSPSLSQSHSEDPIEALDALEDAIDEVGKIIPGLDSPLSPEKPRPTKSSASKPRAVPSRTIKAPSASNSKIPAEKTTSTLGRSTSVRTKTASKIASTTQPSVVSRTRVPTAAASSSTNPLARSTSVKTTNPLAKSTSTLTRSTSTRPRPSSMIAPKSDATSGPEAKKPDYLAAKRRPISVQFPTPPPAAKSSKPPTQATFKLSGDDVAAKLKQAKEERLKRMEAAAAEKKEIKARPAPTIRKPAEVKPTATSKARLSTAGVEPVKDKENITNGGLKRSSTVTGASSNGTKRSSVIADRTKRSSVIGAAPGASIPSLKRSSIAAENGQKAFSSSLSMPKRSAPVNTAAPSANTSAKRLSSVASSTASLGGKSRSVSGASGPTASNKGKDVFNRDKLEKDAREKERREKDEAMKKARADAAERGRQASRDWAEKQKKAKSAAAVTEGAGAEAVAV
jgi:hypothetical protein